MPIIKAGFAPGLHGRKTAATWGRRTAYLGRQEQGHEAQLFSRDGEVHKGQALEELGGKHGEYHEVIISPSANECRALEARHDGHVEAAQRDHALKLGERLAGPDRKFIVAVHHKTLQNGEKAWHFHVAIEGPVRGGESLLGAKGRAQQLWDQLWRESAPKMRIVDWAAHRAFMQHHTELNGLYKEQAALLNERRRAVRATPGAEPKITVDAQYAERLKDLAHRRHETELSAIGARYRARGMAGSAEELVEKDKARGRLSCNLAKIENRSLSFRTRAGHYVAADRGRRAIARSDKILGRGAKALLRGAQLCARPLRGGMQVSAVLGAVSVVSKVAQIAPPLKVLSTVTRVAALPLRIGMTVAQALTAEDPITQAKAVFRLLSTVAPAIIAKPIQLAEKLSQGPELEQ